MSVCTFVRACMLARVCVSVRVCMCVHARLSVSISDCELCASASLFVWA